MTEKVEQGDDGIEKEDGKKEKWKGDVQNKEGKR